jgi:HTH-type transcriptional regulator/antitoxin HigA
MSAVAFNQAVYGRLLANALPQVIRTDEENERGIAKLETLSNRGNLSSEEKALADLLTVLIEKYEERYQIRPASTPAEHVRHFMDAQDLKPADMLAIFGTKSVVSEVLSGKRELSKAHIRALSKRFNVSPELFFS